MRFEGTLTKWNEERGFGFITPIPAGQDIFVHVSAFARDGKRPQLQEVLSFEITMNKDGKKQAVAVRRDRPAPSATVARDWRRTDTSDEPRALSSRIVVFVIACALLAARCCLLAIRSAHSAGDGLSGRSCCTGAGPADAQTFRHIATPGVIAVSMRWPSALLADDILFRGQIFSSELSWREDGWQQ